MVVLCLIIELSEGEEIIR